MCCDFFSDPDHPKRGTSICLKIFLFLTILIGIAVVAVSGYYIHTLKKIGGFAVVTLIVGLLIIGFSIIGFCGSGFQANESDFRIICLRIFWLAVLSIVVVLILVGSVCILSRKTLEYYVIINMDKFQNIVDDLPESAGKDYVEKVKSLAGNVTGVGIMSLIVGIILIIPFLLSSCLMGGRVFLDTVGLYGSLAISLLGVVVVAIVAYFYAYVEIAKTYSSLLVGVIVLGVFLVLLGFLGAIGYAVEQTYKWPIRLFAVLLILILLVFISLAIITVTHSNALKKVVDEGISRYCGLGKVEDDSDDHIPKINQSKCYPIVKSVVTYLCNGNEEGELNPCPDKLKENNNCNCSDNFGDGVATMTKGEFYDATIQYTTLLLKANHLVVGVAAFLVAFYLIIMVVTVLVSCCCYGIDDDEASKKKKKDNKYGKSYHVDL